MRYYGIKHRRFKENSYYSFQKALRFLQLYLPASKKKGNGKKIIMNPILQMKDSQVLEEIITCQFLMGSIFALFA